MISKGKIKYIHSLEQKKFRRHENAFVAEGPKVVGDLLDASNLTTSQPHNLRPLLICALPEWINENRHKIPKGTEISELTTSELQKVSFLQHPQQVIAVFEIPDYSDCHDASMDSCSLTLALDSVQDPGNLGTIIRIADWFGITDIYCSHESADCYNPKVVQATMGSLARVNVHYVNLPEYLSSLPKDIPVYGTFLDGDDITDLKPRNLATSDLRPQIIVMGNEGNGISPEVERHVTHRLLIPSYPKGSPTTDSLNVAIATAITVFHFRNVHNS